MGDTYTDSNDPLAAARAKLKAARKADDRKSVDRFTTAFARLDQAGDTRKLLLGCTSPEYIKLWENLYPYAASVTGLTAVLMADGMNCCP
jgi:hypothetical protein